MVLWPTTYLNEGNSQVLKSLQLTITVAFKLQQQSFSTSKQQSWQHFAEKGRIRHDGSTRVDLYRDHHSHSCVSPPLLIQISTHTADLNHLVPPLGVLFVAGCGGDLLVNILFTLLGWVFLSAPEMLLPLQVVIGTNCDNIATSQGTSMLSTSSSFGTAGSREGWEENGWDRMLLGFSAGRYRMGTESAVPNFIFGNWNWQMWAGRVGLAPRACEESGPLEEK